MIRINLLPVRAQSKRQSGRQWLLLYLFCVGLTGAVMVAVGTFQASNIERLQKRERALRNEVAKYAKYDKMLKNLKNERQSIQEKIRVVQSLQTDRDKMARVLALLSIEVPAERVWFEKVNIDSGRIVLTGVAMSNEAIVEFMRNLEASPYIVKGTVNLAHSRRKVKSSKKLREFQLSCRFQPYSGVQQGLQQSPVAEPGDKAAPAG